MDNDRTFLTNARSLKRKKTRPRAITWKVTCRKKKFELSNDRQQEFVRWSFDCVADEDSAVAEQKAATKKKKDLYPEGDFDFGADSWDLATMPTSKRKIIESDKFDPNARYFKKGAHMPLMVYLGEKNKTRRSKDARSRRKVNAAQRGWTKDRIEASKQNEPGPHRGSGGTSWSGYQATTSSSASSWNANNAWDRTSRSWGQSNQRDWSSRQ